MSLAQVTQAQVPSQRYSTATLINFMPVSAAARIVYTLPSPTMVISVVVGPCLRWCILGFHVLRHIEFRCNGGRDERREHGNANDLCRFCLLPG
jgi:hypothetical protein